ncbi:MAG TPA: toll/interleukin-1 receptor domain-containing protein [Solirubrobacteraceae bacterium]|nr:toll/interleukin-1 receptor domain-containing protein [Solirubrobacteraceae bacterium]
MKVFISWSGTQSHKVAIALRDWLPSVLQIVEPYVSSEDIDKGARWSTDISKELEDSSFGIICVTPENIAAPWVNFEAGALSKSLDRSRVAPFLFAVDRTAVQGPLLQFQSTLIEENDVKKLLQSINKACEDHALDERRLSEIFEVWWPRLKGSLEDLQKKTPKSKTPERPLDDVLAEILELTRGQQKLLSSPEELLPPQYLDYAFRASWQSSGNSIDMDHPVYKELWRRWMDLSEALGDHMDETPGPVLSAAEDLGVPVQYLTRGIDRKGRTRRLAPTMRPPRD